MTKFLCCVGIFLHHFYLRSPYVGFIGTTACVIFFMLSAYGISISLEKYPMNFIQFLRKRVLKIYIPLLMVNILFISLTGYLCKGSFGIPVFGVFGDEIKYIEDTSLLQIFCYTFGVFKMDGVTWFLDVLFGSYILMWIIKRFENHHVRIALATLSYLVYVLVSVQITPPRMFGSIFDPLGIVVGVVLAEDKRALELIKSKIKLWHSVIFGFLAIALGIMLGYLSNLEGRYAKILLLMIAILAMLVVTNMACKCSMKNVKMASYLGGVSYFVYLLHEKVANIVYCLLGCQSFILSALLVGISSLVFYWLYQKLIRYYSI